MTKECRNVLKILDLRQGLVPLVGAMRGETRSIPFLLPRVRERDGSLHDDTE